MKYSIAVVAFILLAFGSCEKDEIVNENLVVALSNQEQEDLTFLREEEKLARDVYIYAYDKYNQIIFSNISNSEQSHMDKILSLLLKYNITDPAENDIEGVFINEDLQSLYDQLTVKVDSSYNDALIVGATIEDLDIHDISTFIINTNNVDLLNAYEVLTCGSRNHLRSFVGQLGTYTPVYLSQNEYDVIINSPNEQCGN
jgi:hypothetical protein